MTEGQSDGKKLLNRRDFLKGAALVVGGAVVETALAGCMPQDVALKKDINEALAARTRVQEQATAQQVAKDATVAAPMEKKKQEVNDALAQKGALESALRQNLAPRGWIVNKVEFISGNSNPTATENDKVVASDGIMLRRLPIDDDPGTVLMKISPGQTLKGTRFAVTITSPANVTYVWGAIRPTEVKIDSNLPLPDNASALPVRDTLGKEQKYTFFAMQKGMFRYTDVTR